MIPNLLLLTGIAPGTQGVGQLFLHDLVITYPKEKISCFALIEPKMYSNSPDLDWLQIAYAPRPREAGFGRLGQMIYRFSGFIFWHYTRIIKSRILTYRIVKFGMEQKVEMVWTILSSPILISIARRVACELGVPLVTTIWDPPELFSINLGFSRFSQRKLLEEYGKVLQMSVRCGVASEGMAEAYYTQYKIEPIVHIRGVHRDLWKPPAQGLADHVHFTIGFVGSIYTKDEWISLLSALSRENWELEGRKISIRVLATKNPAEDYHNIPIEFLGWKSAKDAIELMSQVDVLYLPYWFGEKYASIVRLCFPNKLVTYLAAGRPVFFHGPEDSSPVRFLNKYPAGICCHSMKEDDIINSLRQIINDGEFYAKATKAGRRALEEEFDLCIFQQRFAKLIGI